MNEPKKDITIFAALNKREQATKKDSKEKRAIQVERVKLIQDQFPSVVKLDWETALKKDNDLFGRIMKDMIKLSQIQSGKPGPRPSLDYREGMREFTKLVGDDYSTLPFPEAFRILARGLSFTTLSRKVGLDRNLCYRLMAGVKDPDVYTMSEIAKAFKKEPSYFTEYRLQYIAGAMMTTLKSVPEANINIYRKLIDSVSD